MVLRVALVSLLAIVAARAEWNPQLAASFLDGRQAAWFQWPQANSTSGVCLSCHTGLPYLLARPVLRTFGGEKTPTRFETGLLDDVRKRLLTAGGTANSFAAAAAPAEPVLSVLVLAARDARQGSLSVNTEEAFERLWAVQIKHGPTKGAWSWMNVDHEPFGASDSQYWGASMAALAVGTAPGGYQSRVEIQHNLGALRAYLTSQPNGSQQSAQPLHNRLALVWASTSLRGLLKDSDRKEIVREALQRQQGDGGWTLESIGPWPRHANAPPAQGSNAYATGLTAYVLERAGVSRRDPKMQRALEWLAAHQDRQRGFWDAQSMNKSYEPASIEAEFMRDVATSFAVLALAEAR
jgi:squalene-hopene/tetraprenyl-beta-curcumene cyclase